MGIKYRNKKTRDRQERRKVAMGTEVETGVYRLRKVKRKRRLISSKEASY